MFEIEPEHIAKLDDSDTRELVGRLAERESIKLGADASTVTYGGDQRAADGGIDVRASLPVGLSAAGYLPRRETGFQVKAEKFNAAKIRDEMSPNGALRESINELGVSKGAYIIVSSRDSTSDTMLSERRNAMAAAIANAPDASTLHLDFYDQKRLASWVNQHPGLIPWVREKINQPLTGWQPFKDWSSSPEAASSEYITDGQVRLVGVRLKDANGLDILAGINTIRDILRAPGGVVRIVGLSGVGKTRLVQALFDDRIGTNALDTGRAVYTDMSDGPDPMPHELVARLSSLNHQCIIIVDNCGIELHRKLTTQIKQSGPTLSVVTVEYDISDDEPDNTDVFKLEPSSAGVLGQLLERRFPDLSGPEIRTITSFAEGNARIALVIAETSRTNGSLSNLSDSELFRRLFLQKKEENRDLLHAAKVMSLVYSFDGETMQGDAADLPILAALAGQTSDEFYGHVAELKRRKLVQCRGVWRALLPHALAHKLAKEFLQDRPAMQTASTIVRCGNERLVKSFSRRLGFLHDSEEALVIVSEWVGEGGWLSKLESLNPLGLILFENVAPVAPERVLATIEESAKRVESPEIVDSGIRYMVTKLSRLLAYYPELFDRAARALANVASIERSNNSNDPHNEFVSLFHLYLSGTHASAEQRVNFLLELGRLGGEKHEALVLAALRAMLKTGHFSSSGSFEFGTRRRDYGLQPRTADDRTEWYSRALTLLRILLDERVVASAQLKSIFADLFTDLARSTGLIDELIALAEHIHSTLGWSEGWGRVKATARGAAEHGQIEAATRLRDLAKKLHPRDLTSRIEVYVLPERWSVMDLAEIDFDDEKRYERANAQISNECQEIGKELGNDRAALLEHLPRLVASGSTRNWDVGIGLSASAGDPEGIWRAIVAALDDAAGKSNRNTAISGGFLRGLHSMKPDVCEHILDQALGDERLQSLFVQLQCSVAISDRGWGRIVDALALPVIGTSTFRGLALFPAAAAIRDDRLAQLVDLLLSREDGFATALFIVQMRLHRVPRDSEPITEHEKEIARHVLRSVTFDEAGQLDDYALSYLTEVALRRDRDHDVAVRICKQLLEGLSSGTIYAWDFGGLVEQLARNFPRAVLDVLVEGATQSGMPYRLQAVFENFREVAKCPIGQMDTREVLEWANEKPGPRFALLSAVTRPWKQGEDANSKEWSSIALVLLRAAPDPAAFLEGLVDRFKPMSWGGSRAEVMISRLPLFETLKDCGDPNVSKAAARLEAKFKSDIERRKGIEAKERREEDERFEW